MLTKICSSNLFLMNTKKLAEVQVKLHLWRVVLSRRAVAVLCKYDYLYAFNKSTFKTLLIYLLCCCWITLNLKLGQIFLPNLFQIHSQMQCQDSLTPSWPAPVRPPRDLASLEFCSFWYFVGIVMAAVAATFFSLDKSPNPHIIVSRQTLLNYSYFDGKHHSQCSHGFTCIICEWFLDMFHILWYKMLYILVFWVCHIKIHVEINLVCLVKSDLWRQRDGSRW